MVLPTEDLNPGTRSFIKGTLAMVGRAEGTQKISNREDPLALAMVASIHPREQKILLSLGSGISNQEISEHLFIPDSTVNTTLENIFRKLEVSSRNQAIAKAKALDLL